MSSYLRDGLPVRGTFHTNNIELRDDETGRARTHQKLGPRVLLCSGIYNIIIAGRDL